MEKDAIRIELKEERKKLKKSVVEELSSEIFNKFIQVIKEYDKDIYFVYNDFNNEVKTDKIIDYLVSNNKKVYIPRVKGNDLEAILYEKDNKEIINKFGIKELEGINNELNDFICVLPLLGVDLNGNRLGYGKGYYDRYLKDKRCIKIGICYDFQILEYIPSDIHDIPLDIIVSEKRVIYTYYSL